jgi:hypothetical protein
MSFSDDLGKFELETEEQFDNFVRAVTLEALNGVVFLSPVATGRFRGNWQHNSNEPSAAILEAFDKGGHSTVSREQAGISQAKAGGIEYVINNLPYGPDLEMGSSQQAPHGMVRVTEARINTNIKKFIEAS